MHRRIKRRGAQAAGQNPLLLNKKAGMLELEDDV